MADEPTAQLDSHTSAEIMHIFQRLNQTEEITVIVVTHSEEVARFAHRIITFRDGRIEGDRRDPAPFADAAETRAQLVEVSP